MTDADVHTRRDLRDHLAESMPGSAQRFEEAREHRPGEGRAKAYLLDVHVGKDDVHDRLAALFSDAAETIKAAFSETRDSQFYRLIRQGEIIFLDAFDPRFVVAHTTGLTRHTDELIHALLEASSAIDRAWLASTFLDSQVPQLGKPIQRTVQFDSMAFWSGTTRARDRFWEDDDDQNPTRGLGKRVVLEFRGGIADTADLVQDLGTIERWKGVGTFSCRCGATLR